jgi:molybdopterin synthase catalytic subunit
MFEITDQPIDTQRVTQAVLHAEDGAAVTFLGIVRDNAEGRSVRYLEYEAWPEMALDQMKAIGAEIDARWGLKRLAIVHRIGRLEIGDVAVAIAVGSGHRREAFEACHYAIDRIKETVPIWKKEFYHDGAEWKTR